VICYGLPLRMVSAAHLLLLSLSWMICVTLTVNVLMDMETLKIIIVVRLMGKLEIMLLIVFVGMRQTWFDGNMLVGSRINWL